MADDKPVVAADSTILRYAEEHMRWARLEGGGHVCFWATSLHAVEPGWNYFDTRERFVSLVSNGFAALLMSGYDEDRKEGRVRLTKKGERYVSKFRDATEPSRRTVKINIPIEVNLTFNGKVVGKAKLSEDAKGIVAFAEIEPQAVPDVGVTVKQAAEGLQEFGVTLAATGGLLPPGVRAAYSRQAAIELADAKLRAATLSFSFEFYKDVATPEIKRRKWLFNGDELKAIESVYNDVISGRLS